MLRSKGILRKVEALAAPLFAEGSRVLNVGIAAGEHVVSHVDELGAAPSERFQGAVWRPEGDLLHGLDRLRGQLAPGAKLLLVAPLMPAWWSSTRALLGARPAPRLSRDLLCESLLISGWLLPRVWLHTNRLSFVSGELPRHPDPLDAFFAQPPRA